MKWVSGRDLPVTTGFSRVFVDVAHDYLKLQDAGKLFPGYTGDRFRIAEKAMLMFRIDGFASDYGA